MQRETIISTLHRVDASQSEVASPRSLSLEALLHLARHLVTTYRLGSSRTFDLSGLQRELVEVLLDGRLSPASAALVLHHVLSPLPISDRGTLALSLTHAIRNDRLSQLSHGTLLTLRRALLLVDSDLTDEPIGRLNATLTGRQGALRWNGAVLLVADRVSAAKVEAATLRIAEAVLPRILIVLADDEQNTSREVIFEQLRLQVRCGDERQLADINALIAADAVQVLPQAQLHLARRASGLQAAHRFLRVIAIAVTTPLHLQLVVPRSKA